MPANYNFRNASDSRDIVAQDLGGILAGASTDPLQLILKNTGDAPSTSTRIRIIAFAEATNNTGNPVTEIGVLTSQNPEPGTYNITFSGPTTLKVNGGPDIVVVSNGVYRNTNVIDGVYVVFAEGIQNGDAASVVVNDGYKNTQITQDNNGVPGDWVQTEIQAGNLCSPNMGDISASVIDGGNLAINNYSYVVTFVTAQGESLISNRANITIDAVNKSSLIEWSAIPSALSYNVYRGLNGGPEKFLVNVSSTSYSDNGNLGVQENRGFPTTTQVDKYKFWVKTTAPSDATNALNPRRFRLRAVGLSL